MLAAPVRPLRSIVQLPLPCIPDPPTFDAAAELVSATLWQVDGDSAAVACVMSLPGNFACIAPAWGVALLPLGLVRLWIALQTACSMTMPLCRTTWKDAAECIMHTGTHIAYCVLCISIYLPGRIEGGVAR